MSRIISISTYLVTRVTAQMSDGVSLPSIRETRPVRPSLFKSESTEILVDNVGGLLKQSRAEKDIADVR